MSDDTPTQRFDAPLTPSTPATTTPGQPTPDEKRRQRITAALIVLSALLLAGLIIAVIILFSRDATPTAVTTPIASSTPSSSPSVSSTPSRTPASIPTTAQTTAPAPPPASSGPTLSSFSSSTKVSCNAANNPIPLDFSWVGTGAAAYFAVGSTDDPKNNGQGWTLPPTGSQSDFPSGQDILYPCGQATSTFSIGVYDNSGKKVVKKVIVTNHGTVG
jgi:cytoskeletal protein RodZ